MDAFEVSFSKIGLLVLELLYPSESIRVMIMFLLSLLGTFLGFKGLSELKFNLLTVTSILVLLLNSLLLAYSS